MTEVNSTTNSLCPIEGQNGSCYNECTNKETDHQRQAGERRTIDYDEKSCDNQRTAAGILSENDKNPDI